MTLMILLLVADQLWLWQPIKAAQLGGKIALVEKSQLGGTCLNRGCIQPRPIHNAEIIESLDHEKQTAVLSLKIQTLPSWIRS